LQLIDGLRVQIYEENASYFRFNQFFFRLGLHCYEKFSLSLHNGNKQQYKK
jgi:hypothetical protein